MAGAKLSPRLSLRPPAGRRWPGAHTPSSRMASCSSSSGKPPAPSLSPTAQAELPPNSPLPGGHKTSPGQSEPLHASTCNHWLKNVHIMELGQERKEGEEGRKE